MKKLHTVLPPRDQMPPQVQEKDSLKKPEPKQDEGKNPHPEFYY